MDPVNAPLARNALRILCHHFGYQPNYLQVQEFYIDICNLINEHRGDGGKHTVESLLLQIMADTLSEYVEGPNDNPTEEGEG